MFFIFFFLFIFDGGLVNILLLFLLLSLSLLLSLMSRTDELTFEINVHDIGSHLVSLDIKNLSDDSRRAKKS